MVSTAASELLYTPISRITTYGSYSEEKTLSVLVEARDSLRDHLIQGNIDAESTGPAECKAVIKCKQSLCGCWKGVMQQRVNQLSTVST